MGAQIFISLAAQLTEAERIAKATRERIAKRENDGTPATVEEQLTLARREAICITLKKIIHRESPLN